MNQEPTRTYSKDCKLQDGVEVTITGKVYPKQIFPGSIPVHNRVDIINKSTGIVIGSAFYEIPMGEIELMEKVSDIAQDPEPILFHAYKLSSRN